MAILNFIPEIWSAQLLVSLKGSLVYGGPGLVNRNYEGEISQYGDTVNITNIVRPSVGDYAAHTDIVIEDVDDATRALIIEQSKYFAFEVDDIEKRQARGGVMGEAASEAAYALGDTADQYLAGVMKAGVAASNQLAARGSDGDGTGTGVKATGADLIQMFIDQKVRLDEENVPSQGRWVAVNPEMHGLLLGEPQFVRVDQAGSSEALRNGQMGRAFGFDVVLSNNVPSTAGTELTSYTAISGYGGATTYAEQIAKVEAMRLEKRFADALKGLHLYGSKVIRPEGLTTTEVWL
jgi:hypothetical protein